MKYAELLELARKMPAEERTANLRSLIADPRFAAMVALIDIDRESFIAAGSGQKMSPHHGSLAHCMGSVYALDALAGQLKQVADVPPASKSSEETE